jgi:hypothetical protein
VSGQRVPISDEKQTRVLGLKLYPVFQRTMVVAKVHRTGGTHSRDNTIRVHGVSGDEKF